MKYIYRFSIYDFWHIGENEHYLSDMAAKGLHFCKNGILLSKFQKGVPRQMRYRVELTQNRSIDSSQIEFYKECGWEYAASSGKFHIFRSPVDSGAAEIHTDPAEQSFLLENILNDYRRSCFFSAIAFLVFLALIAGAWFFQPYPALYLIESRNQLLLIIVEFFVVLEAIRTYKTMRELKLSLAEGKPIDHKAPWKKRKRSALVYNTIVLALAFCTILIPVTEISGKKQWSPNGLQLPSPFVPLSALEDSDAFYLEKSPTLTQEIDRANYVTSSWRLLSPTLMTASQNGVIEGQIWQDGSGPYSPAVHEKYYGLRFSFLAEQIAEDLTKQYHTDAETEAFREIRETPLDKLFLNVNGNGKIEISACLGNHVLYLRYYGYAASDTVIAAVEKNLLEIESSKPN